MSLCYMQASGTNTPLSNRNTHRGTDIHTLCMSLLSSVFLCVCVILELAAPSSSLHLDIDPPSHHLDSWIYCQGLVDSQSQLPRKLFLTQA